MSYDQPYFSALGQILIFVVGGVLFVLVALGISRLIRPNRPNPEKLASYESGEEPQGGAWVQFNLRFYVLALIFLLFEVEIVFLFPWATVFANEELMIQTGGAWGEYILVEMIIFIALIGLGLAYAWVNGHLDWAKPDPKPTQYVSPVPRELYDQVNERYK
jgi:NADH-quinone oxidoreductase subunit A